MQRLVFTLTPRASTQTAQLHVKQNKQVRAEQGRAVQGRADQGRAGPGQAGLGRSGQASGQAQSKAM